MIKEVQNIENEIKEHIESRKNSIKITRNISNIQIKPDTSREIWNTSVNVKPNLEIKKAIKKSSFKVTNKCNLKVIAKIILE